MNGFALGTRVCKKKLCDQLTLPIPTCWYIKRLADSMRWINEGLVGAGHVNFMLFVLLVFALSTKQPRGLLALGTREFGLRLAC